MKYPQSLPSRLLPVLGLVVAALLAADVLVRSAGWYPRSSHAELSALPAGEPGDPVSVTSVGGGTATGGDAGNGRRAVVLRRLVEDGRGTYLPSMLTQVDSAIRRWPDDRFRRPLRVGVARAPVEGFKESFAGDLAWSVNQWNGLGLPVRLDFRGADTTDADITVGWVPVLDGGRTGKADVTWDQRQYIRRVRIALATHTPDGRALNRREMTALALHEVGHALGLAHSTDPQDALYPMTRADELSARDRATARLLYELPPGSLRR